MAVDMWWTKFGSKPPAEWIPPAEKNTSSDQTTVWRIEKDGFYKPALVKDSDRPSFRSLDKSSVLLIDFGFELVVYLGIDSSPLLRFWAIDLVQAFIVRYRKRHSISFAFFGSKHALLDLFMQNKSFIFVPKKSALVRNLTQSRESSKNINDKTISNL